MAQNQNSTGGVPPFLARAVRTMAGRIGEVRSAWGTQRPVENIRLEQEHRLEQERQVDAAVQRLNDREVIIDLRDRPADVEPIVEAVQHQPSTI